MKKAKRIILALVAMAATVVCVAACVGCSGGAEVTGTYSSVSTKNSWDYDEVLSVDSYQFGNLILSDDGSYIFINSIMNEEKMGGQPTSFGGPFFVTVTTFGTYEYTIDEVDPEVVHVSLAAAERAIYFGGNTFYLSLYGYLDTGDESTFASFDETSNIYAGAHDKLLSDWGAAKTFDINILNNQITTSVGDATFVQQNH